MKVLGFKAFYTARIVMQVVEGYSGRDFAAYIGVLDRPVSHRPYETIESGGGGELIPEAVKISYADAEVNFGWLIEQLEAKGYRWRN